MNKIFILFAVNYETICYHYNANLAGNDLNNCEYKTNTAEQCQKLCHGNSECVQFTWIDRTDETIVERHNKCCLKKVYNSIYTFKLGIISGPKHCGIVLLMLIFP